MKLLNLVIEKAQAHDVLRDIALQEKIHLVNAMTEINESNFKLKVDEDLIEEVKGLCLIDSFSEKRDFKSVQEKLYKLMDYMNLERTLDKSLLKENYRFEDMEDDINHIFDELTHIRERIEVLEEEKNQLQEMNILDGIYENVDFSRLFNLHFFNVKFGILSKENMERLTKNYDNIYAAILHIGRKGTKEIYIVVSLKELELETDRILRSVYFEEIKLIDGYLDTPEKMIEKIKDRMNYIDTELEGLNMEASNYREKHGASLMVCYAQLMLELRIEQMKKLLALTNNYVYITGWISDTDSRYLEKYFVKYGASIVYGTRDVDDVTRKLSPPTKLKNKWLFKPFEELVHMYGTPSYDELDPTSFVGLAYMFLFGAMFGDLGQGLVLAIAGFFLKKKVESYGGILMRIGVFSMIFGFFYDSLFGYEHVISKIIPFNVFLRPIENINTMLIAGVVTGLVFLMISYTYSVINKLKKKDLKEGLFGRNGIAGIILFVAVLLFAGGSFLGLTWVPIGLMKVVILLMVILMVVREPLANIIKKIKPLHHEPPSEYYVESGFELLETFLGMLSNSLSFVRVGAFALNHVGLFMAFHTIAAITGTLAGEVSMFILGNLLVIGLEGLIVLIQGLRLVYYEMFSKYYTGDGLAFEPVEIENLGGVK